MIARSREIPPSGTFQIRCQLTWRQIKNLPSLSHRSPFLHKMPEFFQFKNCRLNYSSESVNNALGLIDGMSIIVQDRSDEKAGRGMNPGVRVPLWLSAGPCLTLGADEIGMLCIAIPCLSVSWVVRVDHRSSKLQTAPCKIVRCLQAYSLVRRGEEEMLPGTGSTASRNTHQAHSPLQISEKNKNHLTT